MKLSEKGYEHTGCTPHRTGAMQSSENSYTSNSRRMKTSLIRPSGVCSASKFFR
jgi:hypothetical protein